MGFSNTIKHNLGLVLFANSTSPEQKEFNSISKADRLRDASFKVL